MGFLRAWNQGRSRVRRGRRWMGAAGPGDDVCDLEGDESASDEQYSGGKLLEIQEGSAVSQVLVAREAQGAGPRAGSDQEAVRVVAGVVGLCRNGGGRFWWSQVRLRARPRTVAAHPRVARTSPNPIRVQSCAGTVRRSRLRPPRRAGSASAAQAQRDGDRGDGPNGCDLLTHRPAPPAADPSWVSPRTRQVSDTCGK